MPWRPLCAAPLLQPVPMPGSCLSCSVPAASPQTRLAGRWFLVGMASRCGYLAEHSHRLEATAMTVTVLDGQSLDISTFRKLDGICWEIRQRYLPAQARGRFLLKGEGDWAGVDVVVGETDHSSYAILYYQKGRSISVKLYGRTSRVSDAVADKFEQRVRAVGLSEDVTYYFPTYGGWHTVPWEQGAPMARAAPGKGPAAGTEALQRGEREAHPHGFEQFVAPCHPQ
uniref:Complement C8 gamma chain n=1 Tax=Strix occidentalis caurina TaxID=311401 RepID=A0A8D0KZX6_STROC